MEVENGYGVGTPPPTQAGGPALRDMSNQPASGPCERAAKRPRLSSSRLEQLDAMVADPRRLRRHLDAGLATSDAREAFMEALSEALADVAVLRRALLPMEVTEEVAYATGDSLLRVLLNTTSVQAAVATMLLEKLPEFNATESEVATSIPNLILGQLKWLEVVDDSAGLTNKVLEVLPVCPEAVQKQLIGFLPEVVQEEEHQRVVDQLHNLLEQDLSFIPSVLDAYTNMQLEPHLQDHVLSLMLQQLQSVEVEDLPVLLKFVLQACTKGNAAQVVTELRARLHFVTPADPRLAVPDRKQKAPVLNGRDDPEALLLKELLGVLPSSQQAVDAYLKALSGLDKPALHKTIDLWVLLVLVQGGGKPSVAAEALLKKKLLEGAVNVAWLDKGIRGHQGALRQVWTPLKALTERLARSKEEALWGAAAQLYSLLFVCFEENVQRQEVLHALHGHLGSGSRQEVAGALQALCQLARDQTALLARFGAFLANILDHLEQFSDSQLRQVFAMFASLISPRAGSGSSQGMGGRLEDEVHITLNKALSQSSPAYKRIGIMGTLALLREQAEAASAAGEGAPMSQEAGAPLAPGDSGGDTLLEHWKERAESMLRQCESQPACMAFLLDQWADMLQAADKQAPPQQGQAGQQQDMVVPAPLLGWLAERIGDLLQDTFLVFLDEPGSQLAEESVTHGRQVDMHVDDPHLKGQLWMNLDANFTPAYLKILPFAASADPVQRGKLLWLAPILRLTALLTSRQHGNLATIDALLGCPIAMFHVASVKDDQAWCNLPIASRNTALLSLSHAISWLRQVVATFAPQATPGAVALMGSEDGPNPLADIQVKVLNRLGQLHQLEVLYDHLLATCSVSPQLPDLARPLGSLGGNAPAGAAGSVDSAKPAPSWKPEEGRRRLRCLPLAAQQALWVQQPPNLRHTLLLPAAHLLGDLKAKLQALLKEARMPAFAKAQPMSLPPCIQELRLKDLLVELQPLLPLMQQHLTAAVEVVKAPPQGNDVDALFTDLPGNGDPTEALLLTDCVSKHIDVRTVAHSLALSCVDCLSLLLDASSGPHSPSGFQAQLLATLGGAAGAQAQQQPQQQGVSQALAAAFATLVGLSCRSSGNSSLELEMALLGSMKALVAIAEAGAAGTSSSSNGTGARGGAAGSKAMAAMRSKVSKAADALLKESWASVDEAEEEGRGFTWKGRAADITKLLQSVVQYSREPLQLLLQLVKEVLVLVPAKVAAKQQTDPYGEYAALCSATFPCWHRVLFEQLLQQWELLAAQALLLVPSTSKRQGGAANMDEDGLPAGWDLDKAELLLQSSHCAATAYAELLAITKVHAAKAPVLAQAVRLGGKFVDVLLKMVPFWLAAYAGHTEELMQIIKEVQKGNKVVQTICAEAKARRVPSVLQKAPAAKKSIEKFIYAIKYLFNEAGAADAFWMGNLKHKDLAGHTVASQLFDAEEDEEDEEMQEEEDADMEGEDE